MSSRISTKQKYHLLREKYNNATKLQARLYESIENANKKIKTLKRENSYLLETIVDMSPELINEVTDSSDGESLMENSDETGQTVSETENPWAGGTAPAPYEEEPEDMYAREGGGYEDLYDGEGGKEKKTGRTDHSTSQMPWRIGHGTGRRHGKAKRKRQDTMSLIDNDESKSPGGKRRRKTGKRDDRTQAKAAEELPRHPDGSLKLPFPVGKGNNEVTILNIGTVVWDRDTYHTHRYIWPVGFKSQKTYASLQDLRKKTVWTSEIMDGGETPIFQVTAEDMPGGTFQGGSSSAVWKQILDLIQAKGMTAKTHASGPEMLGLTNLGITKYIQELSGAERCSKYVMQRWIEDDLNHVTTRRQASGDPDPIHIVQEHPEEKDKAAAAAAAAATAAATATATAAAAAAVATAAAAAAATATATAPTVVAKED